MASNKELVLQRLLSIGNLGAIMFNKIFNLGSKNYLYLKDPEKDLLHDIGKTGRNLMGIDQQHPYNI